MKLKKILFSYYTLYSILVLAILWALLSGFFPLNLLEYRTYDWMTGFRPGKGESPVVIVAIDNKSIKAMGNWPWPRSYIARMIEHLTECGAGTLGIHLLLSGGEWNPGLEEIRSLRSHLREVRVLKDPKTRKNMDKIMAQSEKRLDHDAMLISAVRSAVNVILPVHFSDRPDRGGDTSKMSGWMRINSLDPTRCRSEHKTAQGTLEIIRDPFFTEENWVANKVTSPFPKLSTKAGGLGHINIFADRDGMVRRVSLLISYQERLFPSFSLQVASKYLKKSFKDFKLRDEAFGFTGLSNGSWNIPTDPSFRMLIDSRGSRKSFQTFSFSDLLAGQIPAEAFRGKIVLLGVTADGIAPFYKTAYNPEIFGVQLAAHIVEDIVNQRYFLRPTWALFLEVLILLYFGFFLLFVIPRVNHRIGALILGIFLVSWIGFSSAILLTNGYWFKIFPPVFLSGLGYALAVYRIFFQKRQQENTELRKMLGLSFQGQGMLDMAYEKFMRCPIEDPSVKDIFYNLGLDFERKRMFNKALSVYKHILKEGRFKDIGERIKKLKSIEDKVVLSAGDTQGDNLLLQDTMIAPTLGRYEILRELGQGAMGNVYLAKDPVINREVAIKTLKYSLIDRGRLSEIKKQFFREAEAAGKLSHPNIVTIYDVGDDDDLAYIAMELIHGKELTEYCRKGKLLSVKRVLNIIASVAEALSYAHGHHVVHRDIKPANIMVLKDGQIKVADFGIARFMSSTGTCTGKIVGTPSYMSPEQVEGRKLDGRSDLFSLGIIFYALLTGEKPFKGENINSLMFAISKTDYVPISKVKSNVPSSCIRMVEGLLKKSVTQRTQSADKLLDQIRACLERLGSEKAVGAACKGNK